MKKRALNELDQAGIELNVLQMEFHKVRWWWNAQIYVNFTSPNK